MLLPAGRKSVNGKHKTKKKEKKRRKLICRRELICTINTSETELILRTYMVTPTSTGGPEIQITNVAEKSTSMGSCYTQIFSQMRHRYKYLW